MCCAGYYRTEKAKEQAAKRRAKDAKVEAAQQASMEEEPVASTSSLGDEDAPVADDRTPASAADNAEDDASSNDEYDTDFRLAGTNIIADRFLFMSPLAFRSFHTKTMKGHGMSFVAQLLVQQDSLREILVRFSHTHSTKMSVIQGAYIYDEDVLRRLVKHEGFFLLSDVRRSTTGELVFGQDSALAPIKSDSVDMDALVAFNRELDPAFYPKMEQILSMHERTPKRRKM